MELPDTKALMKMMSNPNTRDVVIATLFASIVAYRATDMKSFLARFINMVTPESEAQKRANAAYIAAFDTWRKTKLHFDANPVPVNKEGLVDFSAKLLACGKLALPARSLCRQAVEKEIRLYHEWYSTPMPTPETYGATSNYSEPSLDEIALFSTVAFMIALKPELLTETLKGLGEILKGIGEIVPL